MKKIIIGLIALGSISAFADLAPYKMSDQNLLIANDISGAILATQDAKTFVKYAKFDSIIDTYSEDRKEATIKGEGTMFVGGDLDCGFLKITITLRHKKDPMEWGSNNTKYTSSLDKSELSTNPLCQIVE